ncbi:MAG: PEP-CTERM sorting domain-containing protein [Planctomycetota bacterium]
MQADGDYWNITYHIILEPNPASETIWVQPRDCTLYIDEIVVDTICTPEPGTLLLLGLGGMVLLRRR